MTQVDFYILPESSDQARLAFACRLADKAVQQRLDVFMLADSEGEARQLDELLWTFAQNSFLPHRLAWDLDAPAEEPILIGCRERAMVEAVTDQTQRWDVIVNLTPDVPETFSRYQRLAEIVDADPGRREHGRVRYRYYRDRGYELKTHQL
jgi:DNA polymerase-3 subunit chi